MESGINGDQRTAFEKELSDLLNKHCKENGSNTPDYILAEYLNNCLKNFEETSKTREAWFGTRLKINN